MPQLVECWPYVDGMIEAEKASKRLLERLEGQTEFEKSLGTN